MDAWWLAEVGDTVRVSRQELVRRGGFLVTEPVNRAYLVIQREPGLLVLERLDTGELWEART